MSVMIHSVIMKQLRIQPSRKVERTLPKVSARKAQVVDAPLPLL